MTLSQGVVLSGRYELAERIAVGGMGEVWRARDSVLHRDVAVKALKDEYADDPSFTARFQAEARHTAGLSHPGIASVFDFGETDGTPFLVMELVEGEPLSALLRREGRLSTDDTLTIVGQAATALHAAHTAGVVHRDVKPGNILVAADRTVKVTDFGIARAVDTVPVTQTGLVLGTAHYLSPEQSTGGDVTPASDVYALGVVTYECLAGRRPFEGDSAVQIAMAHLQEQPEPLPDDVPESARMLVEQAMAKNPAERFANAGAFARAAALLQERLAGTMTEPLAAAVAAPTMVLPLDGGEPVTLSAGPLPQERSGRSYTPLLVGLGLAVLLVVVAIAVAAARPAPEHALPPLAGKTEAQALAELDRLDLDHDVRPEPHRTVAKGTVLRSEPAAGTRLREGDDVRLIVSSGPKPVALPAGLIGMEYDTARERLTTLGLTVTRDYAESGERAGTVISVTPTSGLHEGATVQLLVSAGRDDNGKGKGEDKDKDDD